MRSPTSTRAATFARRWRVSIVLAAKYAVLLECSDQCNQENNLWPYLLFHRGVERYDILTEATLVREEGLFPSHARAARCIWT